MGRAIRRVRILRPFVQGVEHPTTVWTDSESERSKLKFAPSRGSMQNSSPDLPGPVI